MTTATQGFTRQRMDRSDVPVPMAFVFDESPLEPEHVVTVIDWSGDAMQILRDLKSYFSALQPRRSLPIEALRGRLALHVSESVPPYLAGSSTMCQ